MHQRSGFLLQFVSKQCVIEKKSQSARGQNDGARCKVSESGTDSSGDFQKMDGQ